MKTVFTTGSVKPIGPRYSEEGVSHVRQRLLVTPLKIAISRIVCESVQRAMQIVEYVIKCYELWMIMYVFHCSVFVSDCFEDIHGRLQQLMERSSAWLEDLEMAANPPEVRPW